MKGILQLFLFLPNLVMMNEYKECCCTCPYTVHRSKLAHLLPSGLHLQGEVIVGG